MVSCGITKQPVNFLDRNSPGVMVTHMLTGGCSKMARLRTIAEHGDYRPCKISRGRVDQPVVAGRNCKPVQCQRCQHDRDSAGPSLEHLIFYPSPRSHWCDRNLAAAQNAENIGHIRLDHDAGSPVVRADCRHGVATSYQQLRLRIHRPHKGPDLMNEKFNRKYVGFEVKGAYKAQA